MVDDSGARTIAEQIQLVLQLRQEFTRQLDDLVQCLQMLAESNGQTMQQQPIVCCAEFRVNHGGKSCFLGNRLPFHLLNLLITNPCRFFQFSELTIEVWSGRVITDSAIHSVIRALRTALRDAGMRDLAAAIRVQNRCAGFFPGQSPPTRILKT